MKTPEPTASSQWELPPLFNFDDPKYITGCCGAHITKVAKIVIIVDIIRMFLTLRLMILVPIIGCFIGVYGVYAQHRPCVIIYIILGIASTAFYIFMGMAFGNSRIQITTTETLFVNTIFAIVTVLIEIPFLATYWALAQFLKDRELATPRVGYVVYQHA